MAGINNKLEYVSLIGNHIQNLINDKFWENLASDCDDGEKSSVKAAKDYTCEQIEEYQQELVWLIGKLDDMKADALKLSKDKFMEKYSS